MLGPSFLLTTLVAAQAVFGKPIQSRTAYAVKGKHPVPRHRTQRERAPNFAALATAVGCPWNVDAGGQLQCVRDANATEIQILIGSNSFRPVLDGLTFTNSVSKSIMSSTSAVVPFMIGNTFNDGSILAYGLGLENNLLAPLISALEILIPALSPLQSVLNQTADGNIAQDLLSTLATNIVMQCPTASISILAKDSGYSVWRYLYNASFPNSEEFPDSGAFHASEIPEVFGTYRREGATLQQVGLAHYMSAAWAQFAKDPYNGPGWPQVGGLLNLVGNIGGSGSFGEVNVQADEIDQLCPLLDLVTDVGDLLGLGI